MRIVIKLSLDVDGRSFELEVTNLDRNAWSAIARRRGQEVVAAKASGASMAAVVANLKVQLRATAAA